MSKKQTSLVHDTIIITVITLAAGILLGLVHGITAGPIAAQQAATKAASQKAVFADAESFEAVADWDADSFAQNLLDAGLDQTTVNGVDIAKDGSGNTLGYVVDASNNEGYGGEVEVMVGVAIAEDGTYTVNGISFLTLSETAGMGMKAADPTFKDQFNGLATGDTKQIEYTKTGKSADNQIDAISGATVTTNAVTKAVNGALKAAEYLEGSAS
ncbi:MAG: FMN-binding protein [Eubacterium sp.]|nr:FMN-binding protein [Eubacterium sp.]